MERIKIFFVSLLILLMGCEPKYLPEIPTRINVEESNFSAEDRILLQEVIKLTEKVINSGEFKDEFLDLEMTSMNGFTNEQIYTRLVEGRETAKPNVDYKWDVKIFFFYRDSQAAGTANEQERIIRFNTKFFNSRAIENLVATLVHEYTHLQGFDHVSSLDLTSVPYQVGFLARDIAREYNTYNDEIIQETYLQDYPRCIY